MWKNSNFCIHVKLSVPRRVLPGRPIVKVSAYVSNHHMGTWVTSPRVHSRLFLTNRNVHCVSGILRDTALRPLKGGVSVESWGQIFYSFGCQLEKHSVECQPGIITRSVLWKMGVECQGQFRVSGVRHFLPLMSGVGLNFFTIPGVGITLSWLSFWKYQRKHRVFLGNIPK